MDYITWTTKGSPPENPKRNACWRWYGPDPLWFCDGYFCIGCGVQVPDYIVEDGEETPDTHRNDCQFAK